MHHIVFLHSSADGHLGCFRVLAAVNGAAMDTGVRVSFQIMVLLWVPAQEWDGWLTQ